ncbi:Uncharacterized conserved protein [Janthinobacterium sp. Marseille]|uniref:dUTP diphosphatase n=1 Tax=Herminiimonas aquatilis TaxID=345342 RepID=A0ABW2J7K8_9BURK|nr:dUTP diphosphatase [Janthinobacterium sp. Marseille]ABR91871.1 Uncharacterized conserved protein [Janthinobacterium sp. Marseille]MBX9798565.1 dUTP diphosphatase [Burkholderiaceae bacterium]
MEKLKIDQAIGMLRLQEKMNSTVNPDWLHAGYPFLRAVVIEAAEALEHYGWKWWKNQSADLAQVQIELIDILHFMLSASIIDAQGNIEEAAKAIAWQSDPELDEIQFDGKTYSLKEENIRFLLELMAGLAVSRRSSYALLEASFRACDMDWNIAITQYTSKNVLNIFRQANGYKEGTYIKEWNGKEDNVHLVDIVTALDSKKSSFSEDLYLKLESAYQTIKSQALSK